MGKLLIFILSLTILTSSCAMKKALWEQFEIQSAAPAKSFPPKALSTLCFGIGDSFDEVATITGNHATVPLLVAALLVIAFTFTRHSLQQSNNDFQLGFFNLPKVPLYLRLGRLIYYS